MRSAIRWAALGVIGLWACSSSNNTTPPPTSTVASVTVTPPTAAMNIAATLQLTATVRDTGGAVVSAAVTWTTSAPTVATVSSSGLVTAVGVGSAAVTATVDGKSGQSIITVVSNEYGPVLSTVQIGTSGGTVGTTDISLTIPSGALASTSTIKLILDTTSHTSYPGNSASSMYFVDGIPAGVTVQARVRIKYSGTNAGTAAIALLMPALEESNDGTYGMGHILYPASDSSGYLVATVPVTGRTSSTWGGGAPGTAANGGARLFEPSLLNADGALLAMLNLAHAASASNHFDLWGIGGTPAEFAPKLTRVGQLAEQAYTTLHETMGYDFSFRNWPAQVYVDNIASGAYGVFWIIGGFPPHHNNNYIEYSKTFTDNVEFPGVVIHELYHLAKSNIFPLATRADWVAKNWLDEATSTWVQERHPATALPYANAIALSWNDSLFTGLSNVMVANSGYGKAPLIKYLAKNYGGDAQVRAMVDLTHAGTNTVTAFLQSIPKTPKIWMTEYLTAHMGGTLYPWAAADLLPKKTTDLTLILGLDPPWQTEPMYALGVQGKMLKRDTAMFGPNYVLPIYIDPRDIGTGTIVALQKNAVSTNFRPLSAGDTVKIPGFLLQRPDSILLLLANIKPVAPYSAQQRVRFFIDLRLPEADWYFPTISNINNGTHFVCDRPGESVKMAMDTNATEVWSLLSGAGTWKQTSAPGTVSVTHTWAPTPAYADSLAKYRITLTSTMVTGTDGDTIKAQARLIWNLAAGPGGTIATAPSQSGTSLWWLLIPVSALPLAFRRRTRFLGIAITGMSLLVLAACNVGQISLLIDESFDFNFTKMRFTADPAAPTAPLMQVTKGTGKTTLNTYQSAYWDYITDNTGAKTDSVKVTCTGTGSATYSLDGAAYTDGTPAPTSASVVETVARLLNRDPATVRNYLKLGTP